MISNNFERHNFLFTSLIYNFDLFTKQNSIDKDFHWLRNTKIGFSVCVMRHVCGLFLGYGVCKFLSDIVSRPIWIQFLTFRFNSRLSQIGEKTDLFLIILLLCFLLCNVFLVIFLAWRFSLKNTFFVLFWSSHQKIQKQWNFKKDTW